MLAVFRILVPFSYKFACFFSNLNYPGISKIFMFQANKEKNGIED